MPLRSLKSPCWLFFRLGILTYLALASDVRIPARSPVGPSADSVPTTATLIFLRAERPLFVQLTVLIDGRELRAARELRVTDTFSSLDTNGDGKIDQAERDAAPQALRILGVREKLSELLPRLDTTPQDQQISAAELAAFAQQRLGPPVKLVARVRNLRRSSQAVELFDLLDENLDQQLSELEFAALPTRLRKLDADGDESYSVVEVEPFRNPFAPRVRDVPQNADEAPWLLLEGAGETLLKRIAISRSDAAPATAATGLTVAAVAEGLSVPTELLIPGDIDRNDKLSAEELNAWLPRIPATYRLTVNLPQSRSGPAGLVWTPLPAAPSAGSRVKARPVKNLETTLGGQPLELQVTSSRASQADNLNFYRLRFRRSDLDKNSYLDATEFAAVGLPGATFESVDSDGNGQVLLKELEEFLNLENVVDQGHVLVTYDSNEISLFSLLDRNQDNRLTPRECQNTYSAWQAQDRNQDHRLARHELSGKLRLSVELVKPRLFENVGAMPGALTGEPIMNGPRTTTPLWFQGMDRNQDGDVSPREFLGTAAAFEKWDRDRDGLISAAEAEAVPP